MKNILITGASAGIGEAIARCLASDSSNHLFLLGRNQSRLDKVKASLENKDQHTCLQCDISHSNELEQALKILQDTHLYAVIANAGIGGENDFSCENDRWNEIVQSNLTGTYETVMNLLPSLKSSHHTYTHVIIISSILGMMGVPKYSGYCASKAALLGLARSWAIEFANDKILVNSICPGWVETKMAVAGINQLAKNTHRPYEDVLEEQMNYVPLKKMATPEEVARLTEYLLSEHQTSMTGNILHINNGAYMP